MENQVSDRVRKLEAKRRQEISRENSRTTWSTVAHQMKPSMVAATPGSVEPSRRPSRFTIRRVSSHEAILDPAIKKVKSKFMPFYHE